MSRRQYHETDSWRVVEDTAGAWKEQYKNGQGTWTDVDGVTHASAFADGDVLGMEYDQGGIKTELILVYNAADMRLYAAGGITGLDAGGFFGTKEELSGKWVLVDLDDLDEDVERGRGGVDGSAKIVDRYKVVSVKVEVAFLELSLATGLTIADIPAGLLPPGVKNGDLQCARKAVSRYGDDGRYKATFTIEARMYVGRREISTVQGAQSA